MVSDSTPANAAHGWEQLTIITHVILCYLTVHMKRCATTERIGMRSKGGRSEWM